MGAKFQGLVYCTQVSARLSYIVDVLFGDSFSVTDSQGDFLSFTGITINYSGSKFNNDSIWIVPQGLLSETGIQTQEIVCTQWKRKKIFFQTAGELPFDIFSAAFYLLTRYEEHLPHDTDEYGRYTPASSIAGQEGFLHLPLVNLWMQNFDQYISGRFPYVVYNDRRSVFSFVPTYDIDIAYSYRAQPLWKNIIGFFRDLIPGNFEAVSERAVVYSARQKDPFDIYDWLDELHIQSGLSPIYFFLLAEKRKGNDKNISPRTRSMKELVIRHAKKYATGIHPSWQSGDDEKKLGKEILLLKRLTGNEVTASRQHYIRMQLPGTYQRLIKEGITDDYSMGYGTQNGFRASYTLPYRWYDLSTEKATGLIIHPFCFMDANSIFQQRDPVYEAARELQEYYERVRSVNGEMITIFHNHFLTAQEEWKEWRSMYETFLAGTK